FQQEAMGIPGVARGLAIVRRPEIQALMFLVALIHALHHKDASSLQIAMTTFAAPLPESKVKEIGALMASSGKPQGILLMEGISGTGKTSLATAAGQRFNAGVIDTDHFAPHQGFSLGQEMGEIKRSLRYRDFHATLKALQHQRSWVIVSGFLAPLFLAETGQTP